jgi:hypothetical protein
LVDELLNVWLGRNLWCGKEVYHVSFYMRILIIYH